jgi:NAD+ kinase
MKFRKIGIAYHPLNNEALSLAEELSAFLSARGIASWVCSAWEEADLKAKVKESDLVLTTGGDGTILRVAQAAIGLETPITGINLGKLGFMTELEVKEVEEKLPAILEGEGWMDERAVLETRLTPAGGDEEELYYALNDAVVARGSIARIITIEVSIGGQPLTHYRADGLVVSTATGSTGYSMSAGGPVMYPGSCSMLLTPLMPHLSPSHCLVLEPSAEVKMKVTTTHKATLCVDGHIHRPLKSGDIIDVKQSNERIRFLRLKPQEYFYRHLEQRLKGRTL